MDEVIQFLFNTNHEFSLTTFIVIVVICLITTTVTRYFGERRHNRHWNGKEDPGNKSGDTSGGEKDEDRK